MNQADENPSLGRGSQQENHPTVSHTTDQGSIQSPETENGMSSAPPARASRSPSQLLNKFIEKTLASIPNREVKENYAKAMIMATRLWFGTQSESETQGGIILRRPCSPEHIRIETRFNYKDQSAFKILVRKANAPEFLADMGKNISSESSFKKSYSNERASNMLGRQAASLGGNMLVCTYAEWLYMEDFAFEPLLPQELFELIPGWQCPDPEGNPSANLP